jgi:mannose-6-phosphate isomerase-like protein (cupin superfamily)
MPVIRRETMAQRPDWLEASAFGLFRVPKDGAVELHYHDADEIWFVIEGRARVVSEGQEYEIGPGDLLCTGMGDEHGTIAVHENLVGFFLEGGLQGLGRRGHLHREEHGVPVPRRRPLPDALR